MGKPTQDTVRAVSQVKMNDNCSATLMSTSWRIIRGICKLLCSRTKGLSGSLIHQHIGEQERCVSHWLDVGAALVQTIMFKSNAEWGDALRVKHVLRYTTT